MSVGRFLIRKNSVNRMPLLKRLFWIYFMLLIFEGALRKWVLPQLSAPLLVVRDPIALLIIWEAFRARKWPVRWASVIGFLAAGILSLCIVQMLVGGNPWVVALYGVRSYLLPFPVAFIMGENLDEQDLRQFGKWTLLLLLPLTALQVAQYYAGSSSFLNVGAYKGAVQLDSALGHVRASATFSYVSGPMYFLPLAAAFIFYGMVDKQFVKRWLVWASSFALIIAVPVTGSRSVVYLVAFVVGCVGIAALFGISQLAGALKIFSALIAIMVLVWQLSFFTEATGTLLTRFSQANSSEGGDLQHSLSLRLVDPVTAVFGTFDTSFGLLGAGIGYGSNVASTLASGTQTFQAGESEIPRVITEFGPPAGIAFVLFRFILAAGFAARAFALVREHHPLAWFLAPIFVNLLLLGTLEQPTIQGFMVMSIAFALAAIRVASLGRADSFQRKWTALSYNTGSS